MKSPVTVLMAAVALAACGGSDDNGGKTVSFESLFPANNEIGAWAENTGLGDPGVEILTTNTAVEGLINGDAEPFMARDFVKFGREFYEDGTYDLQLRIWEMPDSSTSETVYSAVLTEDSRYGGSNWQDAGLSGQSRVANTGSAWWFNVQKGAYFVEASGITPNDATGLQEGSTFVDGVLGKIP